MEGSALAEILIFFWRVITSVSGPMAGVLW